MRERASTLAIGFALFYLLFSGAVAKAQQQASPVRVNYESVPFDFGEVPIGTSSRGSYRSQSPKSHSTVINIVFGI